MRRLWLAVVGSCAACALVTDLSDLPGAGDASPDASSPLDGAADAPLDVAPDVSDAASCGAPPALVQSIFSSQFSPQVTSISATFTQPSSDGDYVVVGLNYEGACGAVASVTDTMGNTYERLQSFDSASAALVLDTWGAHVAGGDGGLDTIDVELTSACYLRDLDAVELRGVDPTLTPPVPSASAKGNGGLPDASLATAGPAILFAHTGDQTGAGGPGAGWTTAFFDGWDTLSEYEIVGEAGAYSVGYAPEAGEDWAILGVALRTCP